VLAEAAAFLAQAPFTSEIICVDDGFTGDREQTASLLAAMVSANLISGRVERHSAPRGRGAAIRTGLSRSRGEWSLVTDACGSTPLTEVLKLLHTARGSDSADVALIAGSRAVRGARVSALPHRMLAIRIFQLLAACQGFAGIRDARCAFKLYRADLASLIARHARQNDEIADVEHIALAGLYGFRVREVGIQWRYRRGADARLLTRGVPVVSLWRDLARLRGHIQRLRIREEPARRIVRPFD
jgi:glycosyltransferase involved in cell wall biosynthesis